MNRIKLLSKIVLMCRPFWVPILERVGFGKHGTSHNVSYNGRCFFARAGVGDFGVLNEIFIHNSYQDGLNRIAKGSVVIDVGANIGAFSIAAAAAGARRVFAFEPLKENFDLLLRHIKANNMEDVIVPVQLAVADKSCEATFYYNDTDAGGGTFFPTIHANWTGSQTAKKVKQRSVQCVSLMEYFDQQKIDHCDLLKLDCEGAEFDILQSIGGVANRIGAIILEYHSDGKLDQIKKRLKELGFKEEPRRAPYQILFAVRS